MGSDLLFSSKTLGYSKKAGGPVLRQQLEYAEKGIENMLNAIQQGIITASTKTRLEELEAQKFDLEVSILQAQLQRPRYSKELVMNWISQFKYGDVNSREYQRRVIDTFVNSIYVFDDRLVFTYNFKGGTQTITLKEIEEAFGSDLVGMSPPRRRGLHIARDDVFYFKANTIAHSLRRSSFFASNPLCWALLRWDEETASKMT